MKNKSLNKFLEKYKLKTSLRILTKVFKVFVVIFLVIAVLTTAVGLIVASEIIKSVPRGNEREAMLLPEQTKVMNKDGEIIFKAGTQRENVTFDEFPEVLIQAIIATEDSNFFSHDGLDRPRFLKATFDQLRGIDAGGASTITMQVSKNFLTQKGNTRETNSEKIKRKIQDVFVSTDILEREYTKEELFEIYANAMYLGNQAKGVQAAAWTYFSKDVRDLNLAEASFIAGMFQLPSYFDPVRKGTERAEKRRNLVLDLMVLHEFIDKEEADIVKDIPLASYLAPNKSFNEENPIYTDYINTAIEETKELTGLDPYEVPMLIYTNADPVIQEHLYKTKKSGDFNKDEKWLYGAAVIDNKDGSLAGVIAGPNSTVTSYNYAAGLHHPGSTAKPLMDYAPCFEQENCQSVNETIMDSKHTYSNGQEINNWDRGFKGQMTLTSALNQSRNIPALKLFQRNDNAQTLDFIETLGLNPELSETGTLFEAHSIGGYKGESPISLASAYSAFARGGIYSKPNSVNRVIVDYHIQSKAESFENPQKDIVAMQPTTAASINYMLNYRNGGLYPALGGRLGTSKKLLNISYKSGTSNWDKAKVKAVGARDGRRDKWIVGYTPEYTSSVWGGYDVLTKEYVKNGWVTGRYDVKYTNGLLAEIMSGPHQPSRGKSEFPYWGQENRDKIYVKGEFEDADNDGVPDSEDKCPEYGGEIVDENGCPPDSDSDGVHDGLDQCPNTTNGANVDDKGCEIVLDSDNDGVIDIKDLCANTPNGVRVDLDGCPLDSDNDSIPNYKDTCPNDPGKKPNGCPIIDTDSDGVEDDDDQCPNTPPDTDVDSFGCPI